MTEGWTRIFGKKQYKEVVEMGKPAMKPLYWILYKSQNNGQYEYLCAAALCEISGIGGETTEIGTMKWSTAKRISGFVYRNGNESGRLTQKEGTFCLKSLR